MKTINSNEIEVRTPAKNLLGCTLAMANDGTLDIIFRRGKNEDRIKLDDFLRKVLSAFKSSN